MTNSERADAVEDFIIEFGVRHNGHQRPVSDEDLEEAMRDFTTNLCHLIERRGLRPRAFLLHALEAYKEEVEFDSL